MTDIFSQYHQALPYRTADIRQLFSQQRGWESQYRQIMLLGKQLPSLPEQYKTTDRLVKGCESQVWLHWRQNSEGTIALCADSDARIVKGLCVIILAPFNGIDPQQIRDFDIQGYLAELDLLKHLSPSRSNGIHGIIEQIQRIACDPGR